MTVPSPPCIQGSVGDGGGGDGGGVGRPLSGSSPQMGRTSGQRAPGPCGGHSQGHPGHADAPLFLGPPAKDVPYVR